LGWKEAEVILKHGLLGLVLVGSFADLAAPVVAGSGWVFLAPPLLPESKGSPPKYDISAPLDRWKQVRAYELANEREMDKRERIRDASI